MSTNCNCTNFIPITTAWLIMTENCNLRCIYCFEHNCDYERINMSEEVGYKTIDYLLSNAVKYNQDSISLMFFGGEPLLVPELVEKFMQYANKRAAKFGKIASFAIITNGTIYNERVEHMLQYWYDSCGKNAFDIQLSLDGHPDIQNLTRPCANTNVKSAELVKATVPKFQEFYKSHNIAPERLHIHSVVSKNSLPDLYASYKYFLSIDVSDITFAWCYEEPWCDDDLTIFEREMIKLTDDLVQHTTNINRFPFKTWPCSNGCNSGKKLIAITPTGTIYPCHRFYFYTKKRPEITSQFIMGNILDDENIVDEKMHEYFCSLDVSKINNNKPGQICMACNYEQTGNIETIWDGYYDDKFLAITQKYKNKFGRSIDAKNTKKVLLNHEDRLKNLESLMNRIITASLEVDGSIDD